MTIRNELNIINRKIFIINLIGFPGTLFIGLSLYTLFMSNGDAIHPALNNSSVVYGLLVLGVIIETWLFMKLLPLFKERSELYKQSHT